MPPGPESPGDPAAAGRAGLMEHLGWDVVDRELFTQALAHRSWCAEHPGQVPNERLEFLGDAVLGLIITDFLYRSHPGLPEGELAKARAAVVNSAALAQTAREVQLGNALLLGKGEDSSGGRLKPSILADAMEALIGAIYLDAGYGFTEQVVLRLLGARLREAAKGPGEDDYKTRLQELCAQTYDELPIYRVVDRGPDHAKVFEAEVLVGGRSRGRGEGRSKKQAEQMAAKLAWRDLMAEAEAVTDDYGWCPAEPGNLVQPVSEPTGAGSTALAQPSPAVTPASSSQAPSSPVEAMSGAARPASSNPSGRANEGEQSQQSLAAAG